VAAAFAVVVMGARAPGGGGGRSQAGLDEVLEDGHEEEHGDEDRRGREPEGDGAGVGGGGGGVGAPRGRCRVVPGDDVGGRLGRRARARHSHPRPRPGHAACDGARLLPCWLPIREHLRSWTGSQAHNARNARFSSER
jgi:hypothetical protein